MLSTEVLMVNCGNSAGDASVRTVRIPEKNRRSGIPVCRTIFLVLVFGLWCKPAYAYVDPGTGSALIYIVTAVIISIYFALRSLFSKIIDLLFRVQIRSKKCNLAIHSEDPRYEITFLPVLRSLANSKVDLTYFTMYERDASFEKLPPNVTHQPIPKGLAGYAYLNHLEAKMFVTTTPQLDVMTFRRSKKIKHYCYITHALSESRFARPYAYDFFDSVFCCGKTFQENIRKIESIRQLPEKKLYRTGIPHYDELLSRLGEKESTSGTKTVLIAPSWGPMSLFEVFGTGFVRNAPKRLQIVVRPHPQMKISQSRLYDEILSLENVVIDTRQDPSEAMSRADVLVSDISGIVYEFAFIHEKPVIVVDHDVDVGGLEGHFLRDTESMLEKCRDFIVVLPPTDIGNLYDRIDAVLNQDLPTRIAGTREELIYNWGRASEVASQQIEEILQCL